MRKLAYLTLALIAAPAGAGLYQDIFRGLDILSTPTGSPVFSSATGFRQNGARIGRVRVVPQELGRGYDLEFDRSFGPDASGRPEVFDLGALELQLNGGINATAGYTNRGFLIGTLTSSINQMQFDFRGTTGGQDFSLNGLLNASSRTEINQFGFYEVSIDVSNQNSRLDLEGLIIDDGEPLEGVDTDFDIGPITVKGNVFFDAVVGLLASFGVDTTEIEGIFPKSPIDQIADEFNSAFARVAEEAVAGVVAGEIAADIAAAEARGGVIENGGNDGIVAAPEPASWMLMAIGGFALARRRR